MNPPEISVDSSPHTTTYYRQDVCRIIAMKWLAKYEGYAYPVLRIVAGFLFMWHGSQKLFGFPEGGHENPMYIIVIAGGIEFFGGIMIMLGLGTRIAAFLASGEMAYAYWSVHGLKAVLPIQNQGELAVLYCFLFLFIATRGSGKFGIDYYLQRKKEEAEYTPLVDEKPGDKKRPDMIKKEVPGTGNWGAQ